MSVAITYEYPNRVASQAVMADVSAARGEVEVLHYAPTTGGPRILVLAEEQQRSALGALRKKLSARGGFEVSNDEVEVSRLTRRARRKSDKGVAGP